MRHGHARAARRARRDRAGGWRIRARIERFTEPTLLLMLRDHPAHGYELLEAVRELEHGDRVDMGNLYRLLRALEADGLVRSEWDAAAAGPAKRRYELTELGRQLLAQWAEALEHARERIDSFLRRFEEGGDHVSRT